MTKLMEQAIARLRSIPEEQQDAVAGFILSEVEENQRWESTSVKHADALRKLADEALADHGAGRTTPFDHDTL